MQIAAGATGLYRPPVQLARSPELVEATQRGNTASLAPSIGSGSATAATAVSFRDSARQKLDADYAKAEADGTRAVVDTAYGGRHLDVSGLSDRELAAVAKGPGFTKGESDTAKGALADRMWAALKSFQNSPGDQARAIKAMYPALSQDVKDALGWNQAMLDSGDRIIEWHEKHAEGKTPIKSLFERLLEGQENTRSLKIDTSLIETRGGTVNMVA